MADTRLVQTAVLDSAESDAPVILPIDYRDLDEFCAHHGDAQFWCGVLLGGCGRKLAVKRYTDRLCHFAHHADAQAGPSTCSRGAHSADHLFVRRAVGAWLRGLGHHTDGELRGVRHDDAVDFPLSGGIRLRFQLAPLTAGQWEQDDTSARQPGERIQWFLAHPGQAEAASFDADNPALLMRCQSDGSAALPSRRVEIGTRTGRDEPYWDRLEECTLDEHRQVRTPTLRTRGQRTPTRPFETIAEAVPAPVLWIPPAPRPRVRPTHPGPSEPNGPKAPDASPPQSDNRALAARLEGRQLEYLAQAVEHALTQAAARRKRVTWQEVGTMMGGDLRVERFDEQGRIALLSAIERGRASDAPLLSVVLIAGHPDIPLPYLSRIARVRDLAPADGGRDLTAWCNEEFQRTHDSCAPEHSAGRAAKPPSPAIRPPHAASPPVVTTPIPRKGTPARAVYDALLSAAENAERDLRFECGCGPVDTNFARLRRRLKQAEDARSELFGFHVLPRLEHTIAQAQWLLTQHAETVAQRTQPAARRTEPSTQSRKDPPPTRTPANLRSPSEEEAALGRLAKRVLIEAARSQTRLSWQRLCRQANHPELAKADPETVFQILRAADRENDGHDRPLLSALLRESDPPLERDNFIRIARDRGRQVPSGPDERIDMRTTEIAAVFAYWGHTAPPRP